MAALVGPDSRGQIELGKGAEETGLSHVFGATRSRWSSAGRGPRRMGLKAGMERRGAQCGHAR